MKILTFKDSITESNIYTKNKRSNKFIFDYKNKQLNYDHYLYFVSHIIKYKYIYKNNDGIKDELIKYGSDNIDKLMKKNLLIMPSIKFKMLFGIEYKIYLDYLQDIGFITKLFNYNNDKEKYNEGRINLYSINDIEGNLLVHNITSKTTLNKINKSNKINDKVTDTDVMNTLFNTFNNITVDWDHFDLINVANNFEDSVENRARYLSMLVENNDVANFWFKIDNYGRLHTPITILKKEYRHCLRIALRTTKEVDIDNSQPLFLAKIMADEGNINNNLRRFIQLVLDSKIYEEMMEITGFTRKRCKTLFFELVYGKYGNGFKSDNVKLLLKNSEMFKSVKEWCDSYKKYYGKDIEAVNGKTKKHSILARNLQKMESNLIFDNILKKCISVRRDIQIFTIHDSIIYSKEDSCIVEPVFELEILKLKHYINSKITLTQNKLEILKNKLK